MLNNKVLLILIIVILMISCSRNDNTVLDKVGTKTNKFENSEIFLQYPEGWEVLPNYHGMIVMGFSPVESKSDTFREFVFVVSKQNVDEKDLENFVEDIKNEYKQDLAGFLLLEEGQSKINKLNVHWISYKYEVTTQFVDKFQILSKAYFIKKSDMYYVITSGNIFGNEKFQNEIDVTIKSFRFR